MRIFISYSRLDSEVADKISLALKGAGHKIWKWDETLKPGDNIAKKTSEGIEGADAFVLIVSSNSLASKSVMHEFSALALSEISKRELKIIPVLIDQTPVPSYLSSYLYLDISQNIDQGVMTLVDSLVQPERASLSKPVEPTGTSSTAQTLALAKALQTGRLTLVCGAGISVDAGIPMWSDLLLSLLDGMVEKLSKEHSIGIATDAAKEFHKRYGGSSLIIGKYLKNSLGKDFSKMVRDSLYVKSSKSSDMIDAIIELARPRREGKALDSIITFNFDALVEENLSVAKILNTPIYTEAVKFQPSELPIYHVHGYLPRRGRVSETSDIVFSEDAYHGQFLDPFSWSNLIQLAKFSQNTCLFVGVSLTDPNLRRLLDVAWRKSTDKKQNHYIIKKFPEIDGPEETQRLARLLEEQDANLLGLNVIWVRKYDEIPKILRLVAATGV
ncbi:hypothetical protein FHW83_000955 [Duganella sp. SG902]|uniref:TIR domain-containing protein n=1 Tax=Duganella sp. SG902 TaxID=2587016 RepID=UPI00159E7376|nr:TIR domain-containing protein [Duganella sp. SG902]NVM75175.1 hypothetical protein [Duganella sp. SG902]